MSDKVQLLGASKSIALAVLINPDEGSYVLAGNQLDKFPALVEKIHQELGTCYRHKENVVMQVKE